MFHMTFVKIGEFDWLSGPYNAQKESGNPEGHISLRCNTVTSVTRLSSL